MLAGLVFLSAATGLAAVLALLALSAPGWVTLAAYPVVCSLTLLLSAAVWSSRSESGKRLATLQPHV